MAAPTAITNHWKSVEIPIFSARRVTVNTATGTASVNAVYENVRGAAYDNLRSPAGLIQDATPDATGQPAPEYGYDGPNALPKMDVEASKQIAVWPQSCPAVQALAFSFQVPDDLATFDDGVGDYDIAARIEARMVLRGSGTLAAQKVMRAVIATENGGEDDGLTPPASYNFLYRHPTEYTFAAASGVGDYANWVMDFTNVRDANSRPLRPGDQATIGIWCRQAQEAATCYPTIWWLRFRYRARILGGTPVSSLATVAGAGTSASDSLLIVSGGATKRITLTELKAALDALP